MAGFNHYPDCTCGWCLSQGSHSFSKEQLRNAMRVRDASTLLKRNLANSFTACFVNPNARCPVCFEPVFFYANEFGSRVYFDDLGPPWPKHPCTDNPRLRNIRHVSTSALITRRSAGLTRDLLISVVISNNKEKYNENNPSKTGWDLLIINSINRIGRKNFVSCEHIGKYDGRFMEFYCFSDNLLFNIGDFISKKGDTISFIDKMTLNPADLTIGSEIQSERKIDVDRPAPDLSGVKLPRIIKKKPPNFSENRKKNFTEHQMVESEKIHFHNRHVHVASFCRKFEPIIKSYARSGIRKPRDVSKKLNKEGYRTAFGAYWTPRTTYFLLKLIFSERSIIFDGKKPPIEPKKASLALPLEGGSLTHEQLVSRLEKLGRITISKK